ncbi:membrane-bound PQQ-dependent dehydrogenase, glucose/quinate/shikimate family [Croceicoccus sp. F390]|uniref:Membrane-bound PQQ-dependent dehydrogenase, glucose/quinate/shikimate family n=1 Tax=Croceicoccus esteveae TaxID=3075597 RepID=A0ABU2ZHI5_9SPHN|nr:membrane-bound PQQ-dependent dehydrogenase, glucose/quinate/shikimate family [Croceicoccus sp. F390]MDT0576068.1 membrane-bound PQQ-dependent dehydrogenase, glucose/quinate/shikimate family [Croceicoccus sp. F390]
MIVLGLITLLLGFALLAGGINLAILGGSWGYIVLGLLLVGSGGLSLMRRAGALLLYAAALVFALGWGLWEVGLDWWALAPRGGLLIVIGAALLIVAAWHRRRGDRIGALSSGRRIAELPLLAGVIAFSIILGGIAMLNDPHDIAATPAAGSSGSAQVVAEQGAGSQWLAYGGTNDGLRYSTLAQITPGNVSSLEKLWEFHAGDIHPELAGTAFETTPLMIGDTLYLCTPRSEVIALDASTGRVRWRFDPQLVGLNPKLSHYVTCRGLSYDDASGRGWAVSGKGVPTAADAAALVAASRRQVTRNAAGVAQNIVTGQAEPGAPNPNVPASLGTANFRPQRADCLKRIFLTTRDARLIAISATTGVICPGFGGDDGTVNLWQGMPNVSPTAYYSTSPALVAGDRIVVGGAVGDNLSTQLPAGVVRAFDSRTGALIWNFDSGNPDAISPLRAGATYTPNTPNSWGVASYDAELDLVYLPMGNASPDQWGPDRSDAVERFSSSITAVHAATGKVAWVFQTVHHDLWDYDVPAQPSLVDLTIGGRRVPALVQPTKQGDIFVLDRRSGKPLLPVREIPVSQNALAGERPSATQPVSAISFAPPVATGARMWGVTPVDQMLCRIAFQKLDYAGRFTPPTTNGALTYPGSYGVLNWGSVAVDPERQMLFAMPVYLGFTAQMVRRPDGLTPIVSSPQYGLGNENFGAPYASIVKPFMSVLGLPCQQPPWGFVQAVDMTTGKTMYRHINGTVRDLAPVPVPFKLGVPGIGGPIVTRGGVAFLAAAADNYLRGYDLATGKVLWRARLPAGGQSTPITYLARDGRQIVLQVAGGHRYIGTKLGDSVIAYALPSVPAGSSVP